jgi:pimeloyl-ACP methyl ester carboxylesterase
MPTTRSHGVDIAYEVHGDGPTVLVMVGWGTYAHGAFDQVPWAVAEGRRVVLLDWRGIADSPDDARIPATTRAHAIDAAAVLDAVGEVPAHVVGIVGIGACVAQWLAIDRPDLVRSLSLSGGWTRPDRLFTDQMRLLVDVHRTQGFEAFQQLCAQWSFSADYYNAHAERFLGPRGPWSHLAGNLDGMERLVEATVTHDAHDLLPTIAAPTFVVHASDDLLTGPRLTLPIEQQIRGAGGITLPLPHVVAGRAAKQQFSDAMGAFLDRVEESDGGARREVDLSES